MRLRFFLIIFSVLLVAVSAVSYIHFYFFETERFRLIDQQIESSATALFSSDDLSNSTLADIDQAEQIISDALEGEESDLLIRIHDKSGKTLFSNRNANQFDFEGSKDSGFRTVETDGHTLRILTLPLRYRKRYVEVGLILDRAIVHWQKISYKIAGYIAVLIFFLLALSVVLSNVLLKPLRLLAAYLKYLTARVSEGSSEEVSVPRGLKFREEASAIPDEFSELTRAVKDLSEKISKNIKALQAWTAQMVHEIRTPLTIATNSLELEIMEGKTQTLHTREALEEIKRVSSIVGDFLDWARTENTPREGLELHAIKVAPQVAKSVEKLNRLHQDRVKLSGNSEAVLFAQLELFDQAVVNLIENALKYSPPGSEVQVEVGTSYIAIRDEGAGLPEIVLSKLGEPFNAGTRINGQKGTGLGLARVMSICRKYGWKLEPQRLSQGFEIKLYFA